MTFEHILQSYGALNFAFFLEHLKVWKNNPNELRVTQLGEISDVSELLIAQHKPVNSVLISHTTCFR